MAKIIDPVSTWLGKFRDRKVQPLGIVDSATGDVAIAETSDFSGGGGASIDRELVVITYFAKINFTGATSGDTITLTQIIDVTSTPTTVSSIWRNQSTATDLASAPTIGTQIDLVGQSSLTDGQLRATAVPISGTVTANLSATDNAVLDSIDGGIGSLTETAPATDTASSGLNGRMQRIAQHLSNLLTFFSPASKATSTALEASRVVKASAGTLLGISGYNGSATGQFIQIHNSATLPADTAVPMEVLYVQPLSSFAFECNGLAGDTYSTGIVICNSSTAATKTIGAADCWFNVRYR